MWARDAQFQKTSVTNGVHAFFQIALNGASEPTITFGSNWIASVAHTGGTNTVTVTMKDNVVGIIDAQPSWRDSSSGTGKYATLGTVSNEGTANPVTFVLYFLAAGGGASNDPTGVVGGSVMVLNTNVTTPGGN